MIGRSFNKTEREITNLICKYVEEYNIPLEINLNRIYYSVLRNNSDLNEVYYPNKDFWNIVSRYNIKVLYGIDAHNKGQISMYEESIKIANKIIGKDVISKLQFIENE